jgi:hypothetical protein
VSTKAVIQIIQDEKALRTAAVASELAALTTLAEKLVTLLKILDPGEKGAVHRLFHQFVHGSKDEKALSDIMNDLGRAKLDLGLRLQVANVGLTRTVEDNILADKEVIQRIDSLLQQTFGDGRGLKIAKLLQHRPAKGTFNQ